MFWEGWAGWGLVTVQAVGVDDLHPANSHSWLDSRESCRFATDTSVMTRDSASGSAMAE